MPEPASLAPPENVTVPRTFVPGSVIVTGVGAVLSTRRLATTADVPWLPAASVAIARKSCRPSASVALSSEHEYGAATSLQTSVQLAAPAAERWIVTEATPDPPVSEADAATVTVWRKFVPGSVIVTDGGVQSPVVNALDRLGVAAVKFAPDRPKPTARQADTTIDASASAATRVMANEASGSGGGRRATAQPTSTSRSRRPAPR